MKNSEQRPASPSNTGLKALIAPGGSNGVGRKADQQDQSNRIEELLGAVRQPPRPAWSNVNPGDIGTGFKAASRKNMKRLAVRQVQQQAALDRENLTAKSQVQRLQWIAEQKIKRLERLSAEEGKFLKGVSRFIFYRLTVDVKGIRKRSEAQRVKKEQRIKAVANPIAKRTKDRFVKQLKASIENTTEFVWQELLPISSSIYTALTRVSDYHQQVLDSKAELDMAEKILIQKTKMAIDLRIARHIAQQFKLTAEEYAMLTHEYRAPPLNRLLG